MSTGKFLAFDIGAGTGRVVTGVLDNRRLFMDEIHRFPTGMLRLNNHYYWNIYRFYEEMIRALSVCVNHEYFKPDSIAVDTWGVDFGLLANDGSFLRLPYSYRDPLLTNSMDDFHEIIPSIKIYQITGIAIQSFNSLYQIHAMRLSNDIALNSAGKLLFMPDILNYFLCGEMKTEFTIATTSQLFNPAKSDWDEEILGALGLNRANMNEVVKPGTVIGGLNKNIADQFGINPPKIVSVCSHDTGSAIVAVPATDNDWAFISSGTWSLMGIEIKEPLISSRTFEYNFSNEGGADGTFRFLKNIMGLWLLQQCRNSWTNEEPSISYTELIEMAGFSKPFKTFIDPDYKGFYNPADMPSAIDEFCQHTYQEAPGSIGEYVRVILEGLAFKYRFVLDQLNEISNRKINRLHIIGGGTQNKLLCQFTANVTGLKVIAGPAEGTAAGNLLVQALALGYVKSLQEIRDIVRNSFSFITYYPENVDEWNHAYQKFLRVLKH